ncbi:hypothetical protein MATL_G00057180 [Megalops atlanticus]|uniref:Uncharacterized protein n=1 Tax=Megalops atlanticus TaxID=7932 RepID=A0A9D3T9U9_MEGAT|nr:hypothetical protein MATL_G00057180 [Megalops atlanticus]
MASSGVLSGCIQVNCIWAHTGHRAERDLNTNDASCQRACVPASNLPGQDCSIAATHHRSSVRSLTQSQRPPGPELKGNTHSFLHPSILSPAISALHLSNPASQQQHSEPNHDR